MQAKNPLAKLFDDLELMKLGKERANSLPYKVHSRGPSELPRVQTTQDSGSPAQLSDQDKTPKGGERS